MSCCVIENQRSVLRAHRESSAGQEAAVQAVVQWALTARRPMMLCGAWWCLGCDGGLCPTHLSPLLPGAVPGAMLSAQPGTTSGTQHVFT